MTRFSRRNLLRGAAVTTGAGLFVAGGRTPGAAVIDPCAPPPPPGTIQPPTGAVVPSGDRTGATDSTAAWNDVLRQGKVIDASGADRPTWRIDSALLAYPGSGIYTGAKWDATTCTVDHNHRGNGAVRNHSFAKDSRGNLLDPINGFAITGEGDVRHGPNGSGDLFKLWGDDIILSSFETSVWRGGRWMVSVGKLHAFDIVATVLPGTGAGVGGLRHCGGTGAVFERLNITSGDDVFQVVTGGATADPMFSQDARDTLFKDCVGKSYTARVMIVALQDANNNGSITLGMHAVHENTTFDNVHGYGGSAGVTVKNSSSTGHVLNTVFKNGCYIDQSQTGKSGASAEVYLEKQGTATGLVDGVDLSGLTVVNKRPDKLLFAEYGIKSDIRNVTPMPV